jgi:acyl-CoA synthetase (AMP-forming)/AMP-acid ligase II/3-hydroxymyristoyl/3-hydroxydecanoyl-(acyl carrier protein) dehydratase
MLPLSRYRAPGDPVLLCPGGAITAAAFFAQAGRLAGTLPDFPFVINLCETRHGFMLGFAAGLMRGQVSLLPPGRGRGDWEHLLRQFPDAYVLSDQSLDAERFFDLSRFLANCTADSTPGANPGSVSGVLHMPQIDSGQSAAILFTSGSTGQPVAHPKTWGQLWRGAAHLAEALKWGERPSCAVVGSVSPQHMFGLEATVMLPSYAGIPVHAGKPLLAADIESALRQCGRPSWWMTTPVLLRAPLQTTATLEGLEGILASTMSLPAALAAAAESAWKVPVMEIYGSTETGALAIRRTACENAWVPLSGVSLWREGEGERRRFWAAGPHVGPPVQLDDEIDLQPNGRFLWLGRSTDLIKVGGRRASLSALNRSLTEIPGVEDGVYFFRDEATPTTASHDESRPARRLAAFYVSSTLSPQQVLNALRARIDPAFLPRPLYRVAELPRNANGKFPQAALAKLLAQCKLEMHLADRPRSAIQRMVVPAEHPALPGHFPNHPVVPGVLILARVTEAIRTQLPHIELGVLLNARFHTPLAPGQGFLVRPQLRGEQMRFEVHLADVSQQATGALIASGRWACRPKALAGIAGV